MLLISTDTELSCIFFNGYSLKVGAREGTAFPGAQPVSVTKENLSLLGQHEYYVSWKADGTRYLMLIWDKHVYMVGRDNAFFAIDGLFFPRLGAEWLDNTLLDGVRWHHTCHF
jgi:mRNA-capping enzyme